MSSDLLEIETGAGFSEGPLEPSDEHIAYAKAESEGLSSQTFIVASDLNRTWSKPIGLTPDSAIPARGIARAARKGSVYASSGNQIWQFGLDESAALVLTLPDLPRMSDEDFRDAFEVALDAKAPSDRGITRCYWLLDLDPERRQLGMHCGQPGSLSHLVIADAQTRTVASLTPLRAFTAGLSLSWRHRMVVMPAAKNGPRVVDLEGREIARLDWSRDYEERRGFSNADVRENDGTILLSGDSGLHLWNWRDGAITRLDEIGDYAHEGPDGFIYFLRTCAELWRVMPGSEPELIARAPGHDEGYLRSLGHGWGSTPSFSRDGRYLLTRLTSVRRSSDEHVTVIVDLQKNVVSRRPSFNTDVVFL